MVEHSTPASVPAHGYQLPGIPPIITLMNVMPDHIDLQNCNHGGAGVKIMLKTWTGHSQCAAKWQI